MADETQGDPLPDANPVPPAEVPLASAAETPAADAQDAVSAEQPTHARGPSRRVVIWAVVVLAVAALGVLGYSSLSTSLQAKNSAAASIASAKEALEEAAPAIEPGSQELTESQQSETALDEAEVLYSEGFVVRRGRYVAAERRANDARRLAEGISERVTALETDAQNADPDEAIRIYFTLYEKYPRTPQGQEAIEAAAAVRLESLWGDECDCLASIKSFCEQCPGEVPASVYEAAATRVESIADGSLSAQALMVQSNKKWVKRLRSPKGANFTIWGTSASGTDELTRAIGMLSAAKADKYKSAMILLRDSSKLGEKCSKIASSPVRKSGRTRYFSGGQISRIEKLSRQMDAKLTKARKILSDV